MNTIALSAGHGAGDPGVVNKNLQEADLTRKIATRAAEIVRLHAVDCLLVPDNLTLQGTIDWINARKNQIKIAVEVHINSGGGSGAEGWNYAGGPNESDRLSQYLVSGVVLETGLPSRGIKDETVNRYKKLGFIHDTAPIAALIEVAFIDGDYNFLNNSSNLEKVARGVARGCLSFIGVLFKPELLNTPPVTTQPNLPDSEYAKAAKESLSFVKAYGTMSDKDRLTGIVSAFKKYKLIS